MTHGNPPKPSLADLEGRAVATGPFATGSQAWVERIAMVPLESLDAEDLLVLLGKGRGVRFLLPHALGRLEAAPFDAGAHRAGELLLVACALDDDELDAVPGSRARLARIVRDATRRIDELPDAEQGRIREELDAARERFAG